MRRYSRTNGLQSSVEQVPSTKFLVFALGCNTVVEFAAVIAERLTILSGHAARVLPEGR
jgi:hypothetical protein